jgi:hypothetical protein
MVHGLTVRIDWTNFVSHTHLTYSIVQKLNKKPLPYEVFREHLPPMVGWLPRTDRIPVSIDKYLSAKCVHTFLSIIYIPEVNHRVFQVDGLTWHWGLVFGQLVLYLVLAELYKLAKREYFRRKSVPRDNPATRYEKRTGRRLHVAYTMDPQ